MYKFYCRYTQDLDGSTFMRRKLLPSTSQSPTFLRKEVLMRLTLLRTGYDDAEFLMAGASDLPNEDR